MANILALRRNGEAATDGACAFNNYDPQDCMIDCWRTRQMTGMGLVLLLLYKSANLLAHTLYMYVHCISVIATQH